MVTPPPPPPPPPPPLSPYEMADVEQQPATGDDGQPSGDWMYKSSVFGTRMPQPDKRAEFLNAGALRKLLPLYKEPGEVSESSENDKQAMKLIQRMLKGEDRLKQLDRKVAVRKAKMAQSDGALLAAQEEQENDKGDKEEEEEAPAQRHGARDQRGGSLESERPTTADIAPRDILAEIGMTPTEFDVIDKIFRRVDNETEAVQNTLKETLRGLDETESGVVEAGDVERAVEDAEVPVDSLALEAALEASAVSCGPRRDGARPGERPPVRYAAAQRVRVAVRFDEAARRMGVEHEQVATESKAAVERAAAPAPSSA